MITPTEPRDGSGAVRAGPTESIADILERELRPTVHDWMALVEKIPALTRIRLTHEERSSYLPRLLHDVIARLRRNVDTGDPVSVRSKHGEWRRRQGYTVADVIEESRLVQVSIFTTLHKNTKSIDFSKLLPAIVTIADEVDAQLKQQVLNFMASDAAAKQINPN